MVQIKINGETRTLDAEPETPLLWVLRCELGLTGTKYGCGIGVCGACTVLVKTDSTVCKGKRGLPVARQACVERIGDLERERAEVTTIEKLEGPIGLALRKAWLDLDVVQCGYCQSAQLMAAAGLLMCNRSPSDDDINEAMRDIACRCGTFLRIRAAIKQAAAAL